MKTIKTIILLLITTIGTYGQNVGIGTNTPDASAALDIESTDGGILIPRMTTTNRDAISSPATGLLIFNTTTEGFEYYNGTAWADVAPSAATSPWNSESDSSFVNLATLSDGLTARTGNNRFIITDAGRFSIGSSNPTGHFHVENTGGVNMDIKAGGNGRPQMRFFNGGGYAWNFGVVNPGAGVMNDGFVIRDVSKGQDRFRISSSGYFGMGTNPNSTGDILRVNGSIGASAFNITSDHRLKSDVQNVENALVLLSQLRPVSYIKQLNFDEKSGDTRNEYGFIAQEVRNVLPELVSGVETDTTYLSIDYLSIIPLMTAALQEQDATLSDQQTEIESLKARLERLEGEEVQTAGVFGATIFEIAIGVLLVVLVFRARRKIARMHTEI